MMLALLLLTAGLLVTYNESCSCFKCEVTNNGYSKYFEDNKKCANNLEGVNVVMCNDLCIVKVVFKFNSNARFYFNEYGRVAIPEYTVIRDCRSDLHHKPCMASYEQSNIRIVTCIRESSISNGNTKLLTSLANEEIHSIYETCILCDTTYLINYGLCNTESYFTICPGGVCYVSISLNINNYTRFRKGCIRNYNYLNRVIELQNRIMNVDQIYPNGDKNIELWGTCIAKDQVKYNSFIFALRNIEKRIIEDAAKIYQNRHLWNVCLYCYTKNYKSICAKGEIKYGVSNVIVCYGKCTAAFLLGNNSKLVLIRTCDRKRDRKIGGLNPIIEKLSNKFKFKGCKIINRTLKCRTECSDNEQKYKFCNRWPYNKIGDRHITPIKRVSTLKLKSNNDAKYTKSYEKANYTKSYEEANYSKLDYDAIYNDDDEENIKYAFLESNRFSIKDQNYKNNKKDRNTSRYVIIITPIVSFFILVFWIFVITIYLNVHPATPESKLNYSKISSFDVIESEKERMKKQSLTSNSPSLAHNVKIQ